MRWSRRVASILLAGFVAALPAARAHEEAQPAALPKQVNVYARHNPPFVSVSADGRLLGSVGETAAHVFRELGWEVQLTGNVPEGRLYREQDPDRATRNVIILDTFPTPERALTGWLSRPIVTEYAALAIRTGERGNYRIDKPDDLAGHVISGRIGFSYPVLDRIKGLQLVRMNSNEGSLLMLLKRRVDMAVVNAISAGWQFEQAGYGGQFVYLDKALNRVPLVLSLSRRDFTPEELKAVDEAIEKFQASPEWPALLERSGGQSLYRSFDVMVPDPFADRG